MDWMRDGSKHVAADTFIFIGKLHSRTYEVNEKGTHTRLTITARGKSSTTRHSNVFVAKQWAQRHHDNNSFLDPK